MTLNQARKTCVYCYVSVILTVASEPVISFLNKGKSFSQGLPFSFL